jgi:hypothetical protein
MLVLLPEEHGREAARRTASRNRFWIAAFGMWR